MLQDKTQIESRNRDSTPSEINTTYGVTVTEEKISEPEASYKQKMQRLEQQKFILVTKDILHTSSKVSSFASEKSYVPCQYYHSVDNQSSACPQENLCPPI